ncbi:MAG TPA: 30S ribosomal protein THX [Bacteroidales bacterium]|nr:30S ribosomal protein THX [Bacteroidales bacterium]
MGKGDQKSKRGKIWKGSYGVRRPRKRKKSTAKPAATDTAETTEITNSISIDEPKEKVERINVNPITKQIKGETKASNKKTPTKANAKEKQPTTKASAKKPKEKKSE